MPFFDLFFRPFFFNGLESFLRFLPLKVLYTLLLGLMLNSLAGDRTLRP